ncbi:Helix-turn-helix, type 11 domain protein [Desulforamulus reducens MI-1]|uniref:Helix-turn-helix, type 11 domain protein n=1 Tax=Desulforamulus reducens (strain ATCC BAA-1160 / DSM 100696 / MI-1) TaxID=349161 RepID=A4J612_DESRM|nr:WYL domain-containing protein [Desulforamulus reducens]ABO50515.1 Helix-turn-helix, type 11 domain protein [Desulforamulus reducens MI-1]
MDKNSTRKAKHNHSQNLEIVLKELRNFSDRGGAPLEYLALKCGVSTRQIYRYLNELQNLGYEILKTTHHDSEFPGGYTIREKERESAAELLLINMLSDLDILKNEMQYARFFLKEILIRTWMSRVGIIIPFDIPICFFDSEDAVCASRQTMVVSKTVEGSWEDIKIKVSAKVLSNVCQLLAGDISSKQKLKDGTFMLQIYTKRGREMIGLLTMWGSEVDIIEPGWLRYKVLENCKNILHANRLRRIDKNDMYSTKSKYLISY